MKLKYLGQKKPLMITLDGRPYVFNYGDTADSELFSGFVIRRMLEKGFVVCCDEKVKYVQSKGEDRIKITEDNILIEKEEPTEESTEEVAEEDAEEVTEESIEEKDEALREELDKLDYKQLKARAKRVGVSVTKRYHRNTLIGKIINKEVYE